MFKPSKIRLNYYRTELNVSVSLNADACYKVTNKIKYVGNDYLMVTETSDTFSLCCKLIHMHKYETAQ